VILAAVNSLAGQGAPGCLAASPAGPQATTADLNCSAIVDVTDAVLAIQYALGKALPAEIDDDSDNCPDSCGQTQGNSFPIMFVTQVPVTGFATVTAAFGGHLANPSTAPRGGDLWIRHPDGELVNLTALAGYGQVGHQQGPNAIAVREPAVHWSGKKALFSMVRGAPSQYATPSYRWQIYEITGFGKGESPQITLVPNQPNYNNIQPIYGPDDRILFVSDRPFGGAAHLYPQRDEYESTPTVTGIYSLDPTSGDLFALNQAPSGVFHPHVDSYGRVVFTQWDHLQRDQQADADNFNGAGYGTFDYTDESASAAALNATVEIFPEPRSADYPELAGTSIAGHRFNHFFPWQINPDGTGAETLNHIGRHELGGTYTDASFLDDPNLTYMSPDFGIHANSEYIAGDGGIFHLRESPSEPGTYFGTLAPEFGTDTAGVLVRLVAPVGASAEEVVLHKLTSAGAGRFRNPVPLANGELIASHTPHTGTDSNAGTTANPNPVFTFRLKSLEDGGSDALIAGDALTPGIAKSVTWYTPDVLASYSGLLWELDAVEVRPRAQPPALGSALPAPEKAVLVEEGVDEAALRQWLTDNQLALIVSRDVTTRDRNDRQQPYNLRVPGGVQTLGDAGKVYDVSHLQLYAGLYLRGQGGASSPLPGRRVLARHLAAEDAPNPPAPAGDGAVMLASDGSMAAFVPALRPLSWQLEGPDGEAVVRERNWLTFQAGEIRACPSCHGIGELAQDGLPEPTNKPLALRALLQHWKTL
jgi:hypothetical protein